MRVTAADRTLQRWADDFRTLRALDPKLAAEAAAKFHTLATTVKVRHARGNALLQRPVRSSRR